MYKADIIIPFSEEEMNVAGEYREAVPCFGCLPILKTPIKPYENLKLFLADEKPLWMPSSLEFKDFSVTDSDKLKAFPGITVEGRQAGEAGIFSFSSLKEQEDVMLGRLKGIAWAEIAARSSGFLNDPRAIRIGIEGEFFEVLMAVMDSHPDCVAPDTPECRKRIRELFEGLCSFYDELFYNIAKWFEPDLIRFHDGAATGGEAVLGPNLYKELITPYLKRVVESAHSYGIGFEYCSGGSISGLVPALIEAGADMLDIMEPGDQAMLYKEYGGSIKLGVAPPPVPENADEQQLAELAGSFLDAFPKNAYVGTCTATGADMAAKSGMGSYAGYHAQIYKESRKRYNRV